MLQSSLSSLTVFCNDSTVSLLSRWRYLEARRGAATSKRHLLYERALKALPGSYKARISRSNQDPKTSRKEQADLWEDKQVANSIAVGLSCCPFFSHTYLGLKHVHHEKAMR